MEISLRQKILLLARIKKMEGFIENRILDRYFADSWEQSEQISKDICCMDNQIKEVRNFLNGNPYNKNEFRRFLAGCIAEHPWYKSKKKAIIMESVSCTSTGCSLNCEGKCMKIGTFLDNYEIGLPAPDGCLDFNEGKIA